MKTWIKVLLGIAGAIVLLIAAAFYFTSGVTKVGDVFFAAVGSGDLDQAYSTLSNDFRAGTSETELTAYLAANGMDSVTDTSWSSRAVNNGRGSLTGTLTTAGGESIPVGIDLVKEEGQWKIYAIRKTAATPGASNAAKGLPDENLQVTLVAESMEAFADSVAAQDMTGLHEHISRLWAQQIDVPSLDDVFKSFYRAGSSLQVIKTLAPAFDGPATLSDEGIMEIKGYYPTNPDRVHFELKYIYEGTRWKLMGLSTEVK